ncbi:MAG: DNA-directed RNA polymerase subunit alpha [Candidatus Berkelbacteria bacterium]|nr:DNA-directed RNA polymerase subunit alpha [Candidatus Berkelbacteria bacterium]
MIPENEIPKIKESVVDETKSVFIIEPLLPGYGATMGNALRRVLLSSLPGTAISSIKIDGVAHEFSAIPHVKEDMIEIIMNLRKINFKSFSEEPVTISLQGKGPKVISAKDFKLTSDVEILNSDQYIATLDKSANFDMELVLEVGRGFRPTEDREVEKGDIGRISIDSVFSPVKLINFKTESTRVGQMTNFDKIELEITTNGAISPRDALTQAGKILVQHFNYIAEGKPYTSEEEVVEESEAVGEKTNLVSLEDVDPKTKVADLNLSTRTVNALVNSGIKTVAGLKRLSDLKLSEVKGLGKKGFDEVKELLEG